MGGDSMGKAEDYFFDDESWRVRYLVVDTGWFFGRMVLVGPEAVEFVDVGNGEITVSLTKKQIEESPGIGMDLPVSRQEEMALREHYGWPDYWDVYPAGTAGAPVMPPLHPRESVHSVQDKNGEIDTLERGDPHLRSVQEVVGYQIDSKDGEIGRVYDFVVDDEYWVVRYLAVDTGRWLPGRKVLVAPGWAKGISWAGRRVEVDLDHEAIENSPPYDFQGPIERAYERALHKFFGRRPYWE